MRPSVRPPRCIAAPWRWPLGKLEKAHAWLARALASEPDEVVAQVKAACVPAQFGEALRHLEMAARQVPQNTIDMLRSDADFDAIRNHPRFFSPVLRPRAS